jgi:hypothetical protein
MDRENAWKIYQGIKEQRDLLANKHKVEKNLSDDDPTKCYSY